jgi:ABC-type polysaccharide/polyol phosphate export permease
MIRPEQNGNTPLRQRPGTRQMDHDPTMRRRASGSHFRAAITLIELIYHNTARSVRKTHGNAILAILSAITQSLVLVGVFYAMFSILGLRGATIRGDFLLYIMSGVFLFFTHVKAATAVFQSEGPASPIMQHVPMTTAISIASSALAALYIQFLTVLLILGVYEAGWGAVHIHDPGGALMMLVLAWFSGVSVGLVFLALKPWAPGFATLANMLFSRVNMIASGKMFVANTLPGVMLSMFIWNPLFHIIDQARGFIFINYSPHSTSVLYPVWVSLGLLMIGLMGEFYTRRHASASWGARR